GGAAVRLRQLAAVHAVHHQRAAPVLHPADRPVRGHDHRAGPAVRPGPGARRPRPAGRKVATGHPYAAAAASAARPAARTGEDRQDAAVVLGSGWAPAADAIGPAQAEVPLADLGGFASPTVPGHTPAVRSLAVGGLRVLVFLGRTHLYE